MLIFHVAEKRAWDAARTAGAYAISTRGRTLEDEGFIHASRDDQVAGVLERFYADHPGPLLLLTIDTDLLTAPWREEAVGDDTYPHIFGPINPSAVVDAQPVRSTLGPAPVRATFMQTWLSEFSFRILAATFVMAAAVAGGVLTSQFIKDEAGLLGMIVAAALATAVMIPIARRRNLKSSHP